MKLSARTITILFYIIELLCFVAAVFLITSDRLIPGAIAFVVAVCLPRLRDKVKDSLK